MRLRLVPVVLTAAAILAGCASSDDAITGRPPPVITATHGGSIPPPADPPVEASDVAAVYVAALGGASLRGEGEGPTVFVKDHAYCSTMLHVRRCEPVEISARVRQEVLAHVGPRVRFSADPPDAPDLEHFVVVTLGFAHITGDRATVTVESWCGPLCGYGETQVLHRTGDGWKRTGNTGSSWIS